MRKILTKHILQQGNLDGMCLLYSILNAYKILMKDGNTSDVFSKSIGEKWYKISSIVPSIVNFVSGRGTDFSGVLSPAENILVEESIIRNTLDILNNNETGNIIAHRKILKSEAQAGLVSAVVKNLSNDSVIIFALTDKSNTSYYEKTSHWVCAVDHDDENIFLACSYAPIFGSEEIRSKKYEHRYINNLINKDKFNPTTVEAGSLYVLKLMQ